MLTLKTAKELYEISRVIGSARTPQAALLALVECSLLEGVACATICTFAEPWEHVPPAAATVLVDWRRDGIGAAEPGTRFLLADYGLEGLLRRDEPVVATGLPTAGEGSLILFPLVARDTCYGFLALYTPPPAFRTEALSQVGGLVQQMASALYMMRLLRREARARHEAEQARERQMHLLATISHEMRNPLTSIQGFASTLLSDDITWDPTTQRDFVETISQEADRLLELTDQLLDHARIESGTLRMQPEPTTLSQVLELATPQLNVLVVQHTFELDVPPDLPEVNADPQRLSQVVVNLISNAVKYAPPQSRITVTARPRRRIVRVDVCDEGPGINRDDWPRIFDPFYRSEASNNTGSGMGLGLTICKGIVEGQGGRIWVGEPPGGRGARISFTLPRCDVP